MRTEKRHAETAWKVIQHLRQSDGSDADSIETIASISRLAVEEAATGERAECLHIAEAAARKALQPAYAHTPRETAQAIAAAIRLRGENVFGMAP